MITAPTIQRRPAATLAATKSTWANLWEIQKAKESVLTAIPTFHLTTFPWFVERMLATAPPGGDVRSWRY
jgi:hypothetical protein